MKRWRFREKLGDLIESQSGEFVRFEDHEAEIARLVPLKGGVPVREWALQENLKLAEEGLANYVQDFQRLTEILQACLAAMRIAQENNGRGVGTDWSLMMVAISAALRLEPTSEKQP